MIRLGKLSLYYCDACNVPILGKQCSCGEKTRHVQLTPPGDIQPAFPFDIKYIKGVIEKQFGDAILPKIVILNPLPDIDKMEEVIINGRVAGAIKYDIFKKKYTFLSRPWYAKAIHAKKGYIVTDDGAIESILKSSNLMAPGVREASEEVEKGDEVIIYNQKKEVIATGKAYMDGEEMIRARGMAVKIRWRGMEKHEIVDEKDWNDVVEANKHLIHAKVEKAKTMIKNILDEHMLPYVVSFSGGKDSLATLFLLLDAGYVPPLFFIDTGLEFDETVDNVHETAKKLNLKLIETRCDNAFWQALTLFGLPARDFRWCCKTCKLGPATLLIREHFPKGVVSFIGQRRYESEARARKGDMWVNPWVPGQIGASPIQNWTALHVWLYLFLKSEEYGVKWNRLYEQGFHRIGCWLCPASDVAEFHLKKHKDWEKFEREIHKYVEEHTLEEKWKEYALWRWRDMPSWAKGFEGRKEEGEKKDEGEIPFNFERVANFMNCMGEVVNGEEIIVGDIRITKDGMIYTEREREKKLVKDIIKRAVFCVGCGICVGRCPSNALFIENGKASIDERKCIHCMECIGECPVIIFGRRDEH